MRWNALRPPLHRPVPQRQEGQVGRKTLHRLIRWRPRRDRRRHGRRDPQREHQTRRNQILQPHRADERKTQDHRQGDGAPSDLRLDRGHGAHADAQGQGRPAPMRQHQRQGNRTRPPAHQTMVVRGTVQILHQDGRPQILSEHRPSDTQGDALPRRRRRPAAPAHVHAHRLVPGRKRLEHRLISLAMVGELLSFRRLPLRRRTADRHTSAEGRNRREPKAHRPRRLLHGRHTARVAFET